MIRRIVLVGGVAAMLLTGCAATPTPVSTDEPVVFHPTTPHAPVEIPLGVVATGDLIAADGISLGAADIVHSEAGFRIELPPVDFGDPQTWMPTLSDSPVAAGACGSDNVWQLGLPNDPNAPDFPFDEWAGDPSFFTSIVVVHYPQPDEVDAVGCIQPILATAALTWSSPVTRPWIAVADTGQTPQANGLVKVEGGRMIYLTDDGDNWSAIAERFGITPDDLEYLNPIRTPGTRHEAFAYQVLNLDPADRSDSESRRPH
jgi:hypothetical protein